MITLNQGPLVLLVLALLMLLIGQNPDKKWGATAAVFIIAAALVAALEAAHVIPVLALNAK